MIYQDRNTAFTGHNVPETASAEPGENQTYHGRKHIVAVRKRGDNIEAVKFDDGSTASIEQAMAMAEQGLISDVNTGTTKYGAKTLRSQPDGNLENNLDNLPRF